MYLELRCHSKFNVTVECYLVFSSADFARPFLLSVSATDPLLGPYVGAIVGLAIDRYTIFYRDEQRT